MSQPKGKPGRAEDLVALHEIGLNEKLIQIDQARVTPRPPTERGYLKTGKDTPHVTWAKGDVRGFARFAIDLDGEMARWIRARDGCQRDQT
jgi:hypothetical protein